MFSWRRWMISFLYDIIVLVFIFTLLFDRIEFIILNYFVQVVSHCFEVIHSVDLHRWRSGVFKLVSLEFICVLEHWVLFQWVPEICLLQLHSCPVLVFDSRISFLFLLIWIVCEMFANVTFSLMMGVHIFIVISDIIVAFLCVL